MTRWRGVIGVLSLLLLPVAACGSQAADQSDHKLTVWDYYGAATPIKPAVEEYQRAHPDVKIDYQAFDYDTFQDKFATAVSSGTAPDVATLDATWITTYASNGLLANISDISHGQLNGKPIEGQYAPSALQAMTDDGHYVAALYDFDAYALYYRSDLLAEAHVAVPKTWSELTAAVAALAGTAAEPGQRRLQVLPDTFHFAQFLYQAGGDILDSSNKKATFAGDAGVRALNELRDLLHAGGVYWGVDQGESSGIAGIKDGRVAMLLNGPYLMGVLKKSAPEQSGKWAVAPAPFDSKQGSYLGGTGLSIPSNAKHTAAAWDFIQFLLTPERNATVASYGGAAPATTAALNSAELTKPDPYFGDMKPFPVFLDALASAKPFPRVKQWSDIDKTITDAVANALLDKKSPADALSEAAVSVNNALGN